MAESLLPHNATPAEVAFDGALGARLAAVPVPVPALWSVADIPVRLLPWLAWSLSVDDWDEAWSPERKRLVVAAAIDVHRHKGTLYGIRRALETMGYGGAEIVEDRDLPRIGDAIALIGGGWGADYSGPLPEGWVIGPDDPHWADYWVEIDAPIARSDALRVAARLANVAPVRCRLRSVSILGGQYFLIGDDQWLIGDDIALGAVYYELGA